MRDDFLKVKYGVKDQFGVKAWYVSCFNLSDTSFREVGFLDGSFTLAPLRVLYPFVAMDCNFYAGSFHF